jgi:UDP-2-acetamido-3-amino-2,3-dideoxy-glucuronate N-acetyltransferase
VKKPAYRTHPTAVIDRGAHLGAGTEVWHFCHVMQGARVGGDCVLGQNVFVASRARVGNRCRIQNNVSIYDGVVLEDDVFVGPSAVFTNVKNPRATIDRRAAVVATRVGRGATIGANATIVCGVAIHEYAFVAAGAVVTHDVAAHEVVAGVPARRSGWICRCGETRGSAKEVRQCACHATEVPVGEAGKDRERQRLARRPLGVRKVARPVTQEPERRLQVQRRRVVDR